MRYRNGSILAKRDELLGVRGHIDYVGGVPDSGTPHAIGYANESKIPFARPFIKYTPTWSRSFMSTKQTERQKVAKMKQMPVDELIKDKDLLFVDDFIICEKGVDIFGITKYNNIYLAKLNIKGRMK